MGMGNNNINLDMFINYVQENFRKNLYPMDYEILHNIAKENKKEDIINAINYCREKKIDSVKYLQRVLANKSYEEDKEVLDNPKWLNEEIITEPLSKEDRQFARDYYYQFCDSEEEAEKRIKELGMEN